MKPTHQQALEAVIEAARQKLGWETMAERRSDRLDCHDTGVLQMVEIIRLAFNAGADHARTK